MLVLHVQLGCGSLSITTTVSLLANEFDVQSVLHGQVSLADVNQSCVVHEAMNRLLRKCKYNDMTTGMNKTTLVTKSHL